MGAAASVNSLYKEALGWFKTYFDTEMYVEDFRAIDKDHDGGINFRELNNWVKEKALRDGSSWKYVIAHPETFLIAHREACKSVRRPNGLLPNRIVDVAEFRSFLLHLFAISILWVHFTNADDWVQGYDAGNETLTFEEFRLACKSFTAAQGKEELSDEQLRADFTMLDTNNSNSLGFVEVCDHCCKFIDPFFAVELFSLNKDQWNSSPMRVGTEEVLYAAPDNVLAELNERPAFPTNDMKALSALFPTTTASGSVPVYAEIMDSKPIGIYDNHVKHVSAELGMNHQFQSIQEKNLAAMDAIAKEMERNANIAEFVEVKVDTENLIFGQLGLPPQQQQQQQG